jgi:hypothetical protein
MKERAKRLAAMDHEIGVMNAHLLDLKELRAHLGLLAALFGRGVSLEEVAEADLVIWSKRIAREYGL